MNVLVVNAGSSTLKLRIVSASEEVTAGTDLPAVDGRFDSEELTQWLAATADMDEVGAVGHRVVHGGEQFHEAVRLTPEVEQTLVELTPLAPLHQPSSIAGIAALREACPNLPAIACFDTAFHSTLPPAATTYALPLEWRRRWPLRRFGFHGLSHAWASRRAAELCGRATPDALAGFRVVTCHLGAGASVAAVVGGRCVDTTMGFTPLEGLVMATRSGSIDPGLLVWLLQQGGLSVSELADGLEHSSGLAGIAGSSNMREVINRAAGSDASAQLALDVYLRSLAGHVAAMASSLGGLDALVFTGGVGENAPEVRAGTAARLAWCGVRIDPDRNQLPADIEITGDGSTVRAIVIAAREDIEIVRAVRHVLNKP